jgi:hypothetical protein
VRRSGLCHGSCGATSAPSPALFARADVAGNASGPRPRCYPPALARKLLKKRPASGPTATALGRLAPSKRCAAEDGRTSTAYGLQARRAAGNAVSPISFPPLETPFP